jgi:hypothetical protein
MSDPKDPQGLLLDQSISSGEASLKESKGIVHCDRNNPYIESILINQILLLYRNNINREELGDRGEEILQRYWNILSPGSESLKVALACQEAEVFTIPWIIEDTGLSKSTVYDVVKLLTRDRVLFLTRFEARKPDPSRPGPKARFYTYGKIKDLSWEDPRLREAQLCYESTFLEDPRRRHKEKYRRRLDEISLKLSEYYREKGYDSALPPSRIINDLRVNYPDVEPQDRQLTAHNILKRLRGL